MTIDSSTQFDTVVIACSCKLGEFGLHYVQQGRSRAAVGDDTSVRWLPRVLSTTDPEVAEVISRIKAGTVKAYYNDGGTSPPTWAPVESAPFEFWQFHGRHPFWPEDGFKMLDRLATKGDLEEGTNQRDFKFQGGFVPERLPAASTMIDHPLANWTVFRVSETQLGFRLVIPSSLNIQPADLTTYADAIAFIKWLDQYRTQGEAIPDAFATTPAALSARRWKFPVNPAGDRFATFGPGGGIRMSRVPVVQNVITLTIYLAIVDLDSGRSNSDVSTFDVNRVVTSASGRIAGAGQMIEPTFGSREVAANVRRIVSADGELSMAGGLALVQWEDPGSAIRRIMPLAGFGRNIDWNDLATRPEGGRWAPRPEERPRVDVLHYNGSDAAELWLEDAERFVGYAGADRPIVIHNRGTDNLTVGFEKVFGTPINVLILRPGERCRVRVMLDLDGGSEYVVEDAPPRYMVRGTSFTAVNAPDYRWSTGGVEFGFRPWFANSDTMRRDTDEFSFGAGGDHSSGDLLTDGLANSVHVATVKHHGDIIFYEQTELEARGSGILKNGHSTVLVRQRGTAVTVFGRVWHPDLTGIGAHRTYTTAFIEECQAGDRYVGGLLYPITGTTINFSNVRINSISQIMRVAPRITV